MNDERKLQRVTQVCAHSAQGIFKRIDENRQLLKLLKQEVPELFEMGRCPWIEGWIDIQEFFLNSIVNTLNIESSAKPHVVELNDEEKLQEVISIIDHYGRGIFKRIDENRELLELLKQEVPELFEMGRCPWIEGWIAGLDIFLNDIVHAMDLEPCPPIKSYLRKWTGEKDVENYYMKFYHHI